MAKAAEVDRYEKMNGILDACVAETSASIGAFTKNQKRIGADATQAKAANLSDTKVRAMAAAAVDARNHALREAAIDAVISALK